MRIRDFVRVAGIVLLALSLCAACAPAAQPGPAGAPPGSPQVRVLGPAAQGEITGGYDPDGKPLAQITVEVTGAAPLDVQLLANGYMTDVYVLNSEGVSPFTAVLNWSPMNGGGEYDLLIQVMFPDKTQIDTPLHVTVTGLPVFTPTPPPLSQAEAQARIAELIRQEFGAIVPLPSVYRFDAPLNPVYSRWIGSAYYQGQYYYVDLYDDTHFAWSGGPYSDLARRGANNYTVFCLPAGSYRLLIVYVDYGNLGVDPGQALAEVPVMVDWINDLYAAFAAGQGVASPLRIAADAEYIPAPPVPGTLLTREQILAATGRDPAEYDLVAQIDLDANNTYGNTAFPGLFADAGGLALQGCSTIHPFDSHVNIWSVMTRPEEIQGTLVMVLNHELSHLFGLVDTWPFRQGMLMLPDGTTVDDWIPYEMFGWTDSDGDGVIEVVDPTPYGTGGPRP